MAKAVAKFSPETICFLKRAARQKSTKWLDKNLDAYERLVLQPLQRLAQETKRELTSLAPGYNFPQKGIGRIKRSSFAQASWGGGPYKSWISYSAARPRKSRFEHNPNLFFLINSEDDDDPILVAGGLYMPSSTQMRKMRAALARNASAFEQLFKSKEFARCFPGGFALEKSSKRVPKGYDANHPRITWIKLQAFFVWKPYSKREFTSANFPALVIRDWKQILRLNRLLDQTIQGHTAAAPEPRETSSLLDTLESLPVMRREF